MPDFRQKQNKTYCSFYNTIIIAKVMIYRINSFELMHTNELLINKGKKKKGDLYNNEIALIVIHLYLRGYEFICQP